MSPRDIIQHTKNSWKGSSKENNVQLPVLPYKGKYMYDEKKHELVVVRSLEDSAKEKGLE